jgi:hypothetical protein
MIFAEDPEGIVNGDENVEPSQEWQDLCTTYDALDASEQ